MEQIKEYGYGSVRECEDIPFTFPPQHQDKQPGLEYIMEPQPISERPQNGRKLEDKVAIITGGDSGIGRAVAYSFVKEGASVVIVYYDEEYDAKETAARIKELGGSCLLIQGDLKNRNFVQKCIDCTLDRFGKIDILRTQNSAGTYDAGRTSMRDFPLLCIPCITRRFLYVRSGTTS